MLHTHLKIILISAALLLAACSGRRIQKDTAVNHTIKVMTYNVHHCSPPDRGGAIDVNAIASVIKKQNADVVAVQEVDVNTLRSGKINEAAELAALAGYKSFFFAKAMDYDSGQYGILILSKHPLSDMKAYRLPMDSVKGGEQRMLAVATVTLPGGKVFQFGCAHLEAYNAVSRQMQINEICRIAEGTSVPFVVAGDFNSEEGSTVIKTLDSHFTRTCYNCPPTFEEGKDHGAIDFIAFRPQTAFTVNSHVVVPDNKTSDHMPVTAVLQLR